MSEWFWNGFAATLGYAAASIGLYLLAVVLCGLGIAIYLFGKEFVVWVRSRKFRSITPQAGQVWLQDGDHKLYVTNVYENGRVGMATAPPGYTGTHSSWGESSEEFEKRKRNRHLILLKP